MQSSRCTMSARLDVEDMWNYSKENNLSFFIMSLGALMNSLNGIPEMKRRIIDGKAVEYESLDAVCPIMNKNQTIFREMTICSLK